MFCVWKLTGRYSTHWVWLILRRGNVRFKCYARSEVIVIVFRFYRKKFGGILQKKMVSFQWYVDSIYGRPNHLKVLLFFVPQKSAWDLKCYLNFLCLLCSFSASCPVVCVFQIFKTDQSRICIVWSSKLCFITRTLYLPSISMWKMSVQSWAPSANICAAASLDILCLAVAVRCSCATRNACPLSETTNGRCLMASPRRPRIWIPWFRWRRRNCVRRMPSMSWRCQCISANAVRCVS